MSRAASSVSVDYGFTSAVRPHVRRLFALAYSILRDRHEADEAVQETMVLAWRSWAKVLDPDNPGAWLAKICVRHCLRQRPALLRRRGSMSTDDASAPEIAAAPLTGRMLDLDRAYGKLSSRQRAIVVLTYHHGYTVVEAAGLMGCAAGTARSHLARALATLRKELGDD